MIFLDVAEFLDFNPSLTMISKSICIGKTNAELNSRMCSSTVSIVEEVCAFLCFLLRDAM